MFTESPRFPDEISVGAQGGPSFNSTVIVLDSGAEQIFAKWEFPLHEYDVAFGVKTQAYLDIVKQIFWIKKGQAGGLRFKDWADYSVDHTRGVLVLVGVITDGVYQICKLYSFGSDSALRKLKKPNTDTNPINSLAQQIKKNGTIEDPTHYSIDNTTGLVTFVSGHRPIISDGLTIATCFDVPVRFNTDKMMPSIDDYDIASWGQIPLIEQRFPG